MSRFCFGQKLCFESSPLQDSAVKRCCCCCWRVSDRASSSAIYCFRRARAIVLDPAARMSAPRPRYAVDVDAKAVLWEGGVNEDNFQGHAYSINYNAKPGSSPRFEVDFAPSVTQFRVLVRGEAGTSVTVPTGGQTSASSAGTEVVQTRVRYWPREGGSSSQRVVTAQERAALTANEGEGEPTGQEQAADHVERGLQGKSAIEAQAKAPENGEGVEQEEGSGTGADVRDDGDEGGGEDESSSVVSDLSHVWEDESEEAGRDVSPASAAVAMSEPGEKGSAHYSAEGVEQPVDDGRQEASPPVVEISDSSESGERQEDHEEEMGGGLAKQASFIAGAGSEHDSADRGQASGVREGDALSADGYEERGDLEGQEVKSARSSDASGKGGSEHGLAEDGRKGGEASSGSLATPGLIDSVSPTVDLNAAAGANGSKGGGERTKNKKVSCGECPRCLQTKDCGKCQYCLDKTKYGGKRRLRQRCVERRCIKRRINANDVASSNGDNSSAAGGDLITLATGGKKEASADKREAGKSQKTSNDKRAAQVKRKRGKASEGGEVGTGGGPGDRPKPSHETQSVTEQLLDGQDGFAPSKSSKKAKNDGRSEASGFPDFPREEHVRTYKQRKSERSGDGGKGKHREGKAAEVRVGSGGYTGDGRGTHCAGTSGQSANKLRYEDLNKSSAR